jgi:hypothetical protein
MGYESRLFNQLSRSELTFRLQSYLGIGSSEAGSSEAVIPWKLNSNLSPNKCSKVGSIISAYHLVDVLAMLGGADRARTVDRRSFQVPDNFRVSASINISSPLKRLQGMDKLANWPAALRQFQTTIANSGKSVQISSTLQGLSASSRLLRLIARNNRNQKYTAIEANFLYAATHIACMKELHFQNDVCPDLPEDLGDLVRT